MKKYIKNGLIIVSLILIYWILSNQYDYYLAADLSQFEFISRIKIAGILLFLLLAFFYKMNDYENNLFKRIVKTVFYSTVFGLLFFFTFESFVKSTTLLVYRFSSKEIIEKPYIVKYKSGTIVSMESLTKNVNLERTENKFRPTDLKKIKEGDTIYIEFNKGFLGINYLKSKKIKLIK